MLEAATAQTQSFLRFPCLREDGDAMERTHGGSKRKGSCKRDTAHGVGSLGTVGPLRCCGESAVEHVLGVHERALTALECVRNSHPGDSW